MSNRVLVWNSRQVDVSGHACARVACLTHRGFAPSQLRLALVGGRTFLLPAILRSRRVSSRVIRPPPHPSLPPWTESPGSPSTTRWMFDFRGALLHFSTPRPCSSIFSLAFTFSRLLFVRSLTRRKSPLRAGPIETAAPSLRQKPRSILSRGLKNVTPRTWPHVVRWAVILCRLAAACVSANYRTRRTRPRTNQVTQTRTHTVP